MTTRANVIAALQGMGDDIAATVESMPPSAWSANVYESGWNARQLLYHMASTSGPAGFILQMSKLPPRSEGPAFDNDAFNRQQVALREGRSPAEVLDEIRANVQRDIQAVETAAEEELQRKWTAPWGTEGTVAEIIVASLQGHLRMHLDDLRRQFSN
jgi:uncharacterized protein (TIGR03083 family)